MWRRGLAAPLFLTSGRVFLTEEDRSVDSSDRHLTQPDGVAVSVVQQAALPTDRQEHLRAAVHVLAEQWAANLLAVDADELDELPRKTVVLEELSAAVAIRDIAAAYVMQLERRAARFGVTHQAIADRQGQKRQAVSLRLGKAAGYGLAQPSPRAGA